MGSIAGKGRGVSQAEVDARIQTAFDHDQVGNGGGADPHTEYQKEAEKGAANGYAGLDGAGRILDANAALKSLYSTGGAQALVPGDIGAQALLRGTMQLNVGPPAFTLVITVPPEVVIGRLVFGWFRLIPAAGSGIARAEIEVEDAPGAGTYTSIVQAFVDAGGPDTRMPFVCAIPAGYTYRFTRIVGAGATVTLGQYSEFDL